jgi:cytochrome c oxidase subunit 2
MNSRRVGLLVLAAVVGLAVLADPVAAQGADTTTEALIDDLNSLLLYLAIPIAVLVEGILIYTVWKYRNQDEPQPTKENRRLEIGWTVATAVILIAVGIGAYTVMANPYVSAQSEQPLNEDQEPIEIEVVAQQFYWQFHYPNETVQEVAGTDANFTTQGTLVMPADRPVELNITSTDVLHAFHVPEMGLKQDAFPGQYNALLTKATTTGEYQLYCAEFCGAGHSGMFGAVNVTSQEEFAAWVESETGN